MATSPLADLTKECQELRKNAEKSSALTEIVESLTQEKLGFVADKDELKKKLHLSEKKVESLSEKLKLSEDRVDDFSKDAEQHKEILKKLRKKINELESEKEATDRSVFSKLGFIRCEHTTRW